MDQQHAYAYGNNQPDFYQDPQAVPRFRASVAHREINQENQQMRVVKQISDLQSEICMQLVGIIFFGSVYFSIRNREPCGADVPTVLLGFVIYLIVKFLVNYFQLKELQRNRRENPCLMLLSVLLEMFLSGWMIYAMVEFF